VPNPGRVENLGWRIRAVVDLNGDGQTDLIWQNMAEGWLCAWLMNGVTAANGVFLNPASVSGGLEIMGPRRATAITEAPRLRRHIVGRPPQTPRQPDGPEKRRTP